jgi:hypothetical protein
MDRDFVKKILRESTSDTGSRGSYVAPLMPGFRLFNKDQLAPFINKVSKFDDAELDYDSLDGKMDETPEQIKKMEKKAVKISKFAKKHPVLNDDNGDIINQFSKQPKKINQKEVSKPFSVKENWVEIDENVISEDLAVWFGTKKKPKGSKQPKGPWVNICKKVDGKHPPCGRSEATDKAYPKCRAAGVAGKMSDSQKKAACAQKRRAEKSNPKSGTGNKPKLVSYKPKKKMNEIILDVLEGYKKSFLNEASKKDVLVNKLGLSPESAESIDRRFKGLSVWITNKLLSMVGNTFMKNGISLTKEETLKEFENSMLRGRLNTSLTSVSDYIRVGLNGNVSSIKDLRYSEIYEKSKLWHDSLEIGSGKINYEEKNPIVIDFRDENGNGFYWVNLMTNNSPEECERMGHCGRSSYGNLYSLREVKPISDKYKLNKSHLTAAIGDDGILYQLKGTKNSKPKDEFHKYILPLFYTLGGGGEEDDYLIQGFGSEYASQQDFKLSDLPNEVIIDLYKNRPELFDTRSLRRKLVKLGVIEAPQIDYNITLKIDPDYVGDYVAGDYVLSRRKVKKKTPAGGEYESTVETRLFETILSGNAWELWDNYDVDWKSSLNYNVNKENEEYIVRLLKLMASGNTENFDEEEFNSKDIEELIKEYDEDDEIKNAISNATSSAESDDYVNHLYGELKSELEEIGHVESMTDEGVVMKINMEPYLNNLSDDEYDEYMERCDDDLECVLKEMISDGQIEIGKFSIDDRWYPDVDEKYFNEMLNDNLGDIEHQLTK